MLLEIHISYPLLDVFIRFSALLHFALKAFNEVDIQFVLFEFVLFYYEKR